jgi:hypothetical protein
VKLRYFTDQTVNVHPDNNSIPDKDVKIKVKVTNPDGLQNDQNYIETSSTKDYDIISNHRKNRNSNSTSSSSSYGDDLVAVKNRDEFQNLPKKQQ